MPTIEVDIGLYLFSIIIAFFALPFILGWGFYKSYKNPEFWLKLRRKEYVYMLMRTLLGILKQVVIPLDRIGENGEFTVFKGRKYFWAKEDPNKEKQPGNILFTWRKKPGALFDWDDPYPQKWIPGNSLTSITDPATLDDISEMKALLMMMNADSMTKLMRLALMVSVVGLLFIAGLAFTVYTQGVSVEHLSCILLAGNNATQAAACH